MNYEMLVAIIALIVSLWQGVVTRKHNRLSVIPILRIDRLFTSDDTQGILLYNTGAGPAVIDSITVLYENEPIENTVHDKFSEAMKRSGFNPSTVNMYVIHPSETFAAGEKHFLMAFITKAQDEHELSIRRAKTSRITFNIKYHSVYKEEFSITR